MKNILFFCFTIISSLSLQAGPIFSMFKKEPSSGQDRVKPALNFKTEGTYAVPEADRSDPEYQKLIESNPLPKSPRHRITGWGTTDNMYFNTPKGKRVLATFEYQGIRQLQENAKTNPKDKDRFYALLFMIYQNGEYTTA